MKRGWKIFLVIASILILILIFFLVITRYQRNQSQVAPDIIKRLTVCSYGGQQYKFGEFFSNGIICGMEKPYASDGPFGGPPNKICNCNGVVYTSRTSELSDSGTSYYCMGNLYNCSCLDYNSETYNPC